MPGHYYTSAEYALQKVDESFGNLLFKLAEYYLTHTYAVVFRFCELENIDHLVLRYLNTGTLPYEEFSEEWLYEGEGKSSSILEPGSGTVSIWIGWKKWL